ncbi:MAG TPA: DUF485 domain-containing protein [Fimbriimonas sp.]
MREGAERSFDPEAVLQRVMRRQAGLSLRIAAVFILLLVGLPLTNLYLPELAGIRTGGFTLTWLFLGVLFFPITWLLSTAFVNRSNEIEAELAAEIGRHERPHEPPHPLEEVLEEEQDDLAIAPPVSPPPTPSPSSLRDDEEGEK